jgi:hypothetical protein
MRAKQTDPRQREDMSASNPNADDPLHFASNARRAMPPLNKFKRYRVREPRCAGCEPCPEILERLNSLKPDEGLLVIAPFLPSPLIERFVAQGFGSRVERGAGSEWIVYFWRKPA